MDVSINLETLTSNATIDISNISISGSLHCDTSSGKISLEKVDANNIHLETSNGRVTLKSIVSNARIEIRTSNGPVEFDDVSFQNELVCHDSNASIKGKIAGKTSDYTIKAKTSNAKSNLPEKSGTGSKGLVLDTSNGDIDIGFLGD